MRCDAMKMVITGAASGMGQRFARRLAEAGGWVVAVDRDEEGLAWARDVEGLAGRVVPVVADITQEAEVERAMDLGWQALGSLNGLVNCAGVTRDALTVKYSRRSERVETMSLEAWNTVLAVNLSAPFLCTRALVARMIQREVAPGVIVNISSTGRRGSPGQANYAATKAGIVADTVVWAQEFAHYGIRVGAIAPGYVDTPMIAAMRQDHLAAGLGRVPLRRAADPDEIWLGVRFIIECDYFTGACIDISGGL